MAYEDRPLSERIDDIERLLRGEDPARTIDLRALPQKELRNELEFSWRPEAGQLIQPKSVDTEEIGQLPGCRLHNKPAAGPALAAGVPTLVTFGVRDHDISNMATPSSAPPSRINIRVAGVYSFTAQLLFTNIGVARELAVIIQWFPVSGGGPFAIAEHSAYSGTLATEVLNCATLKRCAVGDYLEVNAYDSAGGAFTDELGGLGPKSGYNHFTAQWHSTNPDS